MNKCKTCKYWAHPKLFRDGPEGRGNLWTDELGQCLSGRLLKTHSTRRPHEPTKAAPDDAYVTLEHANLMTGPEFGCIHHEEK